LHWEPSETDVHEVNEENTLTNYYLTTIYYLSTIYLTNSWTIALGAVGDRCSRSERSKYYL